MNDLKVFASYNEDLYKEMTQLLTTDDFRCDFCANFSSFRYADYCVLRSTIFLCPLQETRISLHI